MESILIIIMIIIWVTVTGFLKKASGKGKNAVDRNRGSSKDADRWHTEKLPGIGSSKRAARSSDGHFLKKNQDITCRQFGHDHPEWEEPATRYIVHDDPEDGFIILNGKKMRITEADKYENTI